MPFPYSRHRTAPEHTYLTPARHSKSPFGYHAHMLGGSALSNLAMAEVSGCTDGFLPESARPGPTGARTEIIVGNGFCRAQGGEEGRKKGLVEEEPSQEWGPAKRRNEALIALVEGAIRLYPQAGHESVSDSRLLLPWMKKPRSEVWSLGGSD